MSATSPVASPYEHRPVLLKEVLDRFDRAPSGRFADVTLGGGGHAAALLERRSDAELLGTDRDEAALSAASVRLASFGSRAVLRKGLMSELCSEIDGSTAFSGVLADLGVSSPQLDHPERGFSFSGHELLDMRMDRSAALTAADVVNGYPEADLVQLFRENGEERLARRYARAVVAARPLTHTDELAAVIASATPAALKRGRIHPATRVFQALRVEANGELGELEGLLGCAQNALVDRGVMVVISYHSGEDRRVKQAFAKATKGDCTCPPRLPCICGSRPWAIALTKGVVVPSKEELAENPRSRSAKLRAIQRVIEPSVGVA